MAPSTAAWSGDMMPQTSTVFRARTTRVSG
jgi:hypothetical protein